MNANNQPDNLSEFFKISMLASGTPAAYQKSLSRDKEWRHNVCSCSPVEAVSQKMICRPCLNMVKGSMETDFPAALKAVLNREIETCSKEEFLPRILVNCSSIDQIKALISHSCVAELLAAGKAHFITIHSPKGYSADNAPAVLTSTVDGQEVSTREAYDAVEAIDENGFGDSLPVIVFQVGMIGEGINVRSFNSVIVTTHSDRTAMQQVGRALRNFTLPSGKNKIDDGHATVYAFIENISDLKKLVLNMQDFDLTSDCYDWGDKVDVSTGSGVDASGDGPDPELNGFVWSEIDELDVMTVMAAAEFKAGKSMRSAFVGEIMENSRELLAEFMDAMKNDPEYFEEYGFKNVAKGFDRAAFEKEAEERRTAKQEDAGKKSMTEKKTPSYVETAADFIVDSLITLNEYLDTHRDAAEIVWPANRKAVLDEVFGNSTMTAFFCKVISDEFAARLAGHRAKAARETSYDNDVKETKECQETFVQRPTGAVRTQTPENISGSSKSMSAGTIGSRMLRWLTSLLRQ